MPIVTIKKKLFEANTEITSPSMFNLANNSASTFATPNYLSEPDPVNPGEFINYKFLFWNILSTIHTSDSTTITDVGSTAFEATAWYLKTVGGPGPSNVRTSAFSIGNNVFLSDTPIDSVDPASAWPSPTSKIVFTNNSNASIDAVNAFSSENFDHWAILWGTATVSGDHLNANKGNSAFTVAFYKHEEINYGQAHMEFELMEVFDRYRRYLGDFVSDPAPYDLVRIMGELQLQRNAAQQEDELNILTRDIQNMNANQLDQVRDTLDARVERLRAAVKMIDATLKKRGK